MATSSLISSGSIESSSSADGSGVISETRAEILVLPTSFYYPFLSEISKARKPSPIRGLYPLEKTPGVISLLAGKPNAALFPFTSVQFTAPHADGSGEALFSVDDDLLSMGLQYAPTAGIQPWNMVEGGGRGGGSAVQALVNPGDPVLVEKPVYAGVIPMFETLRCEMIDRRHGINSHALRQILNNWPSSKLKPKVLYTVPYGCNPTGATTALNRRKEVLDLLREHNILILEDDPYYFLYFGTGPRIPSYFMLEAQTGDRSVGRVLRFDSFSKMLSAGTRIGFVTGPDPLLDAIDRHTATANLQPSSFSQAVIFTLLRSWGRQGFLVHTHRVAEFYRANATRHLHGIAEWNTPEAGMFFWNLLLGEEGDSTSIIQTKAFEGGVLALPGAVFFPNGGRTAYVRASFSLLEEDEVNEALYRLRVVLLKQRAISEGSASSR
ncbi:PLP-dependent transferase [Lactifluus volemus]|nr:PLP-dependent transferase [Lactifluus volemus]